MTGRPAGTVAWWPASVAAVLGDRPGRTARRALPHYVVLEEVVGRGVELVAWPWPDADQQGRLSWRGDAVEETRSLGVDRDLLVAQMYLPGGLRRRPRAGDTFATTALGPAWPEPGDTHDGRAEASAPLTDLREVFPGTVLDISADSREAAKLAYQGANAGVVPGARTPDLAAEAAERARTLPPAPRLVVPGPGEEGGR